MRKKNFRPLFFSIAVLVVILGIYFVLAYPTATDIIFEQNSSAYADSDGHFTINWTNDTFYISQISNWSMNFWMNDNFVNTTDDANTTGSNFSWGYTWMTNATVANYTFSFAAFFENDTRGTNSSNVSMYVDGTVPLVNWTNSGYNNATPFKKNTDTLAANVWVGDAASGLIDTYCVFNISTVANYTVEEDGGWCNSTTLNLTSLADGNHTIDVYVNDSANNVGVNFSYYVVWIDTTAPAVPTFSCTPSSLSLRVGDTLTCTCTGSDAGSGINTSYGTSGYSFTASPSTAATGTFNITCTTRDYAENQHSASLEYTVHEALSTGGTTTTPTWTHTYRPTDEQAAEGYTKELSVKNRVKVSIDGADHHVGVLSLTETEATIEIASDSVEVTLEVGEDAKVDVTDDGFYDIYVLLNAIVNSKADVTIQKIHEEIPEGAGPVETPGEVAGEEEVAADLTWLWILIAVVVLVVVIGGGIAAKKKK